jgi:hypothetical protein
MQAPFVKHAVAYYDAVSDGGCDNTGESDCVSDILAAVTAYKAAGKDGLYFPAGTYLLSSALTVPDGTTLIGADMDTAWLKGDVRFGSTSSFTDLKMGAANKYTAAVSGANTTTFTRCQFVGGTTTQSSGPLNLKVACHTLTFTDCTIDEGNLINNGITINAVGATTNIHDILFDGCTIEESRRIGFECTNRSDSGSGYSNINMTDCTFEVQGGEAISYDCTSGASGGCTLTDVLIKGAGNSTTYAWNQGFELNGCTDFTITRMTIYRTWGQTLNLQHNKAGSGNTEFVFTDCTFDQSVKYITRAGDAAYKCILWAGTASNLDGMVFDNCTFNVGTGITYRAVQLESGNDNNDFSTSTFTGTPQSSMIADSGSGNSWPA